MSKLHKSRSPTRPLPVGGHLCVLHPAMTFCTRFLEKLFFGFFSQSGCVGIGRPLQYAFTCLSSSSVRPHPDLLHGQPFLLGLKYFSNSFPTNFYLCQPIGLNICFNYSPIKFNPYGPIFTHPDRLLVKLPFKNLPNLALSTSSF